MSLLEHYRVLGISVGAGMAEVAASYKRLCRIHHPDVSSDPESEEIMKRINVAYTALREKLRREAAFRERQVYVRQPRRYSGTESRTQNYDVRKASQDAEKEAYSVLNDYFRAINTYDYVAAYSYLSSYDRRHISRESFIEWRKSVARLYPMREFLITGGLPVAAIAWGDGRTLYARRFRVAVKEENLAGDDTQTGDVEKLVIQENGFWRVFLGYMSVRELTQAFDERLESKRKHDVEMKWDEYYTGLYPEYDMLSLAGMHKAASREIYRHRRFGGAMTFAAISLKAGGRQDAGQEQLLQCAARTISAALRESDISAYAGDGVFALLLVELRKRNAAGIIARLIERIRKNAGPQLGALAEIYYEFESFGNNSPMDMAALNKVLRKFRKKM